MLARKPLVEIAIYSIAMPATVGLCLWVLLGPFRVDRYLSLSIPQPAPEITRTATDAPVSNTEVSSAPATDAPVSNTEASSAPATAAEASSAPVTLVPVPETATVILFPDDDGHLLAQLQGALAGKGYSVGPGGADANDSTLSALEAFQSDNALPVQPNCDQQCRTALGLPDPR